MSDREAEAAAHAARNTPDYPDEVVEGTLVGHCPDCGEKFEYGAGTGILNLDPCPGCGSEDWQKWGVLHDGELIPKERIPDAE